MRDNTTKTIFWAFLTPDYKAMIEQLEDMARQGWMLEKINSFRAKFRAIPPQNITYYVDVFPGSGVLDADDNPRLMEYRKLCEESGWHYVTSRGHLQFFCSSPDVPAVPIQTDLEIESNCIKSTVLRSEYLGMLLFFIYMLYHVFRITRFDYRDLLTFTGIASDYVYPFIVIPMGVWFVYIIIWHIKLVRCVKNGQPMPTPSLKSAKLRAGIIYLILAVFVIIMFLAILGDAVTGAPYVLFALIPLPVGLMVGLGLKKFFKTSNNSKKNKVVVLISGLIAAAVLASFLTLGLLSGFLGRDYDEIEAIPADYLVLTLEDFPGYKEADIKMNSLDRHMSPIVPEQFDYWEIGENHQSISSEYYRAVTPYFARKIFVGKLEEETRYGKMIDAPASDWDADEAFYFRDKQQILLIKGTVVIYVDGDFDLSDPEMRNVVISKLLVKQ
ncbi:MAG: DUF2812 domain-containing protein [Bacillota bacterium]|nr:DUF2812 domain-containing protein [Bacillota bacterium]